MRRGPLALVVLATLAGCSRPAEPAANAPAATAATALQTAAAPSGSGLTGEVSSLSGEITDFSVEQTAVSTVVEIAADVLFAFDSDALSPQAPTRLRRAAELIRQGGAGPISVVGHTDAQGEDDYNLDLSLRRARSVVAWLSSQGAVPADRLVAEGKGETEPVAPNEGTEGNDYPEGRAMNRRVVIVIPKA